MSTRFHGGGLDAAIEAHGGDRADWLDLSTGINPNPWKGALAPIPPGALAQLPDDNAMKHLLAAARKAYGVKPDFKIVAGNGTQALIEALPPLLMLKHVAIVTPTYNEHENVWGRAGARVTAIAHHGQLPDDCDGLVVVRPNNPDGAICDAAWLAEQAVRLQQRSGWLVLDEAFADAVEASSMLGAQSDRMIILRSFGKFFGLAGIRLGFAVLANDIAVRLATLLGPWSVNGPALHIGSAALADRQWIADTRIALAARSTALAQLLSRSGFEVVGQNPLFVYVKHANSALIAEQLARQCILVRPFPEQPGYLRFGLPQNEEAQSRLAHALGVAMAMSCELAQRNG